MLLSTKGARISVPEPRGAPKPEPALRPRHPWGMRVEWAREMLGCDLCFTATYGVSYKKKLQAVMHLRVRLTAAKWIEALMKLLKSVSVLQSVIHFSFCEVFCTLY